jgi:AcrR family transcriptional regulator
VPRQGLDRATVIEAAQKLADKSGYAQLTLGNIARALGVKPPSLYKYITSLEDLQDAVGIGAAKALILQLEPVAQVGNPQRAIHSACLAYREFAHAHPGLYASLQPAMARRGKEFQAVAASLLKIIFLLVTALGVKKADLVHAVRSLRAMLHGFIEIESVGGFGMPEDVEASFRYHVELYATAIKQRYK